MSKATYRGVSYDTESSAFMTWFMGQKQEELRSLKERVRALEQEITTHNHALDGGSPQA